MLGKKSFFADKGGLNWPLNFGGRVRGQEGDFTDCGKIE